MKANMFAAIIGIIILCGIISNLVNISYEDHEFIKRQSELIERQGQRINQQDSIINFLNTHKIKRYTVIENDTIE